MFTNQQHFSRKAFLETVRASKAQSEGLRRWHQELASKYDQMAKAHQVDP